MQSKRFESALMLGVALLACWILARPFIAKQGVLTEEKRICDDAEAIAKRLGAQAAKFHILLVTLKGIPSGQRVSETLQRKINETKQDTEVLMAKSRTALDTLQSRLNLLQGSEKSKMSEAFIALAEHWLQGGLEDWYGEIDKEQERIRTKAPAPAN